MNKEEIDIERILNLDSSNITQEIIKCVEDKDYNKFILLYTDLIDLAPDKYSMKNLTDNIKDLVNSEKKDIIDDLCHIIVNLCHIIVNLCFLSGEILEETKLINDTIQKIKDSKDKNIYIDFIEYLKDNPTSKEYYNTNNLIVNILEKIK